MRNQLTDLQRQLGTGKKSDNYAGIGISRGLTVGLRSQISSMSAYGQTIGLLDVRLKLGQTALSEIASIARSSKITTLQSPFVLNGGNQTTEQKTALSQLDQLLGLLNTQAGERYLFAGKSGDQPAVASLQQILDGDGARAGLKQVINERRQADLGAGGLGRLVISSPTATSVTVAEDFAGSPFGFKLASVNSTLAGATVTGPAGAPPGISVDLTTNPAPGETIEISFNLPDGTTSKISLTARAIPPAGPNEFTIGATPTDTRANLQAAITSAIDTLAGTALTAASAVAAGQDFFNIDDANPPKRVSGPPFDTATAVVNGTASNTVNWYIGEAGSDPARSTATGRVDQSLVVSYGMRANEQALRTTVQSIAVFAATTFSGTDPDAVGNYDSLKQRIATALNGAPGLQQITDIQAELAGAQTAAAAAKDRHQQTTLMVQNFLQDVEGAPQEEVAAQLLALQTSLQASLQTTAMLLQTNLLKYL
jgi:flagellin-like hook-associated protein FlgL